MKHPHSMGDMLSKALERYKDMPVPTSDELEEAKRQAFAGRFPYGNCPICRGAGWFTYDVPVGHPEFGKAQKCTNPNCDRANELAARRLANYDLPASYRMLSFETWQALPAAYKQGKLKAFYAAQMFVTDRYHSVSLRQACQQRVKDWEEYPDILKNSLVFSGDLGMGKTGLVACIINALARGGYTGITYRRTSDLLQDLMDGFNDRDRAADYNEKSYAQRLANYKSAAILILDEWNIVNPSPFKLQSMEDIIRHRHGHNLPTLVTTNLTRESSYKEWGERTADVLSEMAHWVEMNGRKLRQVA